MNKRPMIGSGRSHDRYFVLTKEKLSYYDNEDKFRTSVPTPKGTIDMKNLNNIWISTKFNVLVVSFTTDTDELLLLIINNNKYPETVKEFYETIIREFPVAREAVAREAAEATREEAAREEAARESPESTEREAAAPAAAEATKKERKRTAAEAAAKIIQTTRLG